MITTVKPAQRGAPISFHQPQPIALDGEMVERAAQALFEFVFACSKRFDGKHLWANCDEDTKKGFRSEATIVIQTVWPFLFHGEVGEDSLRCPVCCDSQRTARVSIDPNVDAALDK